MGAGIPTHAPKLIDVVARRPPPATRLTEAKVKPGLALGGPGVVGGDGVEGSRDVRRDQRHDALRVRPERHARPDLAEARRRLVQRRGDALLQQRERQRHARDAAAHHADREGLGWCAGEFWGWCHGRGLRFG